MSWRARSTRTLLWISVLAWGVLVGGKLFDLRMLVGAWSASPPESLNLLPYGPHFPVDTGEYFFPSSVALLLCSFAALITGWQTPWRYRIWLILPAIMMLAILIFTVSAFWPRNAALWAVAQGFPGAIQDPAEVAEMVRQWVSWDWIRVAMGFVGYASSVRAISVSFPGTTADVPKN